MPPLGMVAAVQCLQPEPCKGMSESAADSPAPSAALGCMGVSGMGASRHHGAPPRFPPVQPPALLLLDLCQQAASAARCTAPAVIVP